MAKWVYSILFYPITLGGRWCITDEFATIPFHLDLFSAALVELAKSIPVHSLILSSHFFFCQGWSGGAMVLGKLLVPGRPTIWMTVGQGPTALAAGGWGLFGHFFLSFITSLFFLPLFGRRPDID